MVLRLIRVCKVQWRCSIFLSFWFRIPSTGKFGPKTQFVCSNWKLIPQLIWIFRIQCCFHFIFLDWKYLFWTNLVQNVKSVSLSWNLVFKLIRIWKTRWWCSVFLFLIGSILFWELCSKILNLLKLEYRTWTNSNM